jgi:hypothetical protein
MELQVTFSIAEALFFYRNIKIKRGNKIMFWQCDVHVAQLTNIVENK